MNLFIFLLFAFCVSADTNIHGFPSLPLDYIQKVVHSRDVWIVLVHHPHTEASAKFVPIFEQVAANFLGLRFGQFSVGTSEISSFVKELEITEQNLPALIAVTEREKKKPSHMF